MVAALVACGSAGAVERPDMTAESMSGIHLDPRIERAGRAPGLLPHWTRSILGGLLGLAAWLVLYHVAAFRDPSAALARFTGPRAILAAILVVLVAANAPPAGARSAFVETALLFALLAALAGAGRGAPSR